MKRNKKRLTFAVIPDVKSRLDGMKKDAFYDCSRSEMIRTLVEAGLRSSAAESEPTQSRKQASA